MQHLSTLLLIRQVKQGEHAMRMLAIAKKHEQDLEMELQQARTAANDADLRWQKERVRAHFTTVLRGHVP